MAHADELGRDLPMQPLLDALASIPPSDADAGARRAAAGPALDAWPTASAVTDTASERAAWFEAVMDAMCGDDPSRPTLLVVDDAEVADATTRAWLAWVAGQRGPLLVLATARPGHDLVGERLELGPLDVDAVGELVGGRPDPQRDRDLHRRSAGNPLLALAIAAAPGDGLPSTVEEAVAAIVEGLGPPAASVVQAAAVLGADVDVDLLAGVVDVPAAAVIERLEAAAEAGLLVERGAGFRFRHGAMREALQTTVGPARRALLHRHAARALDQRPHARPAGRGRARPARRRRRHRRPGVRRGGRRVTGTGRPRRRRGPAARQPAGRRRRERPRVARPRADDRPALRRGRLRGGARRGDGGWAVGLGGRRLGGVLPRATTTVPGCTPTRPRRAPSQRAPCTPARSPSAGASATAPATCAGPRSASTGAMHGPAAVRSMAEVWLGQVRAHEGRPLEALALADRALIDPEHVAHPFAALHGRFTA